MGALAYAVGGVEHMLMGGRAYADGGICILRGKCFYMLMRGRVYADAGLSIWVRGLAHIVATQFGSKSSNILCLIHCYPE